jgi:osmotically-inducible protein OsmY
MKFRGHHNRKEKFNMNKIVNEFSERLQNMIQENDAIKDDWDVEVFEENGIVTLTGAVPSQKTLEKVEAYVRKQEGVDAVINELDIDPDLDESEKELVIKKEDYVPPIRNHPS